MQLLRHHAEPLCAGVGVSPPGPILARAEAVVPARGVAVVVRLEDAVIGGEVTVRLALSPGQVLGLFMGVRPHIFTWSWKHISQILRESFIGHPTSYLPQPSQINQSSRESHGLDIGPVSPLHLLI